MAASVPLARRLILASASQGRRQLLQQAGYTFTVEPAYLDEPTQARRGDCQHYVAELAWLKAQAVAPRHQHAYVLAADTVGWLDGQVIGKPVDAADARRILRLLAGRTHELWTGVCLWLRPEDWQICWQERSLVYLKPMTEADIDTYLQSRLWQGCSGAYALQLPDDPHLTVVQGSASNVIGLPMESLQAVLHRLQMIEQTPLGSERPPTGPSGT
ncbi:MAG: Maf family protein [Gemmataceae bacterium]|nr:Maf family protein [Gemmataceae bacterium]MCS7269633.1 Maf family protein [Gemmataceae bacterium]MDW8243713.1 nucleoside triphosphate pyrophosphatase [Thermogemmata sp.]